MNTTVLLPAISTLCQQLATEFDQIPTDRKALLQQLADYIFKKYQRQETPKLIVICTHNSRRSHMGQIWLSIAAEYYNLAPIESYSGGTEATAFNPRAVAAVQKMGIQINTENAANSNPNYQLKWTANMPPYTAFSKRYDHAINPANNFAAIMVCTEADEACPIILNADFRLALPYNDPKAYDDTPLEREKYEERFMDIGRELLFVFSLLK